MEHQEQSDPEVMQDIAFAGVDLDRRARLMAMAVALLKEGLTRGEVKDALEEFVDRMDWDLCSPNDPTWITHSACQERDKVEEAKWAANQPVPVPDSLQITCLADVMREPVRWLWAGKIPLGKVTVIYGERGDGKTQLAFELIARVSAGGKWPHEAAPLTAGKVMLVNGDDPLATVICGHLEDAGANMKNVSVLTRVNVGATGEARRVDLGRDLAALKLQMKQIGSMRMVVVDCLESLCGKGNAGRARMRSILADLEDWAMDTGMAIVVLSDSHKCDLPVKNVWRVARDVLNLELRCWIPERIYESPLPERLAFTVSKDGFAWGALDDVPDPERLLGEAPQRTRSRQLKQQIEWLRRYLLDGPKPARVVLAVGKVAGYSASQIKRAKQALQVACYKEQKPKGKWIWEMPLQKRTGPVIGKTHVFGAAPAPTPAPAPFPQPSDFNTPSEWYLRMLKELEAKGMKVDKLKGEG